MKEIRNRYEFIRNNLVCHINDELDMYSKENKNKSSFLIADSEDDVKKLRQIFNEVRINNQLPLVVTMHSPSEEYPIIGFKNLIERVFKNTETEIES